LSRVPDSGIDFSTIYARAEPNVYVPAGFVPKVDYQRFYNSFGYSLRWEGKWLELLSISAYNNYEKAIESGLKTSVITTIIISGQTRSRIYFSASAGYGKIRANVFDENSNLIWENKLYTSKSIITDLSYSGSRKIQMGIDWYKFRDYVYNDDFTGTRPGKFSEVDVWSNFRITPQLQWRVNFGRTAYHSFDKIIDFKGALVSSSVNFQLNKQVATYLKFQYDSSLERFQYDFLIGYEMTNLSKIYLSIKNYSENRFRFFSPDARSIALKVSYLFRI
jgi:hypothetical protein